MNDISSNMQFNKDEKGLTIGMATFKKTLTKKQKQILIQAQKQKILASNIWKLCNFVVQVLEYKTYVNQNWSEVLKHMESATCQRIDLHNNQYPQIIKSLTFPCFTNIVTLVLQKNKIDNIEALTFLNMETINFIDLDDNCITNLKSFNQLKWSSLRKLQLSKFRNFIEGNNFIQQFQFSRMKTKNHVQKIYLDEMFDLKVMTQDISMLLKLQTHGIDNLQIQAKHRIKQSKVFQKLSQKYQTIQISDWTLYQSEQDQNSDQDQDQDQDQEDQDQYIILDPVSPV